MIPFQGLNGPIPNLPKLGPQQMPGGFGVGPPQVGQISGVPQAMHQGPGAAAQFQAMLQDPQVMQSFMGLLPGGGQGQQAPQMSVPNLSVQPPQVPQVQPPQVPQLTSPIARGLGGGAFGRGLF